MTTTHPMVAALRELGPGPFVIKLRQKTSQPMTFASGKLKEERTTIVEEHVEFQAASWKEAGDSASVLRFTLDGGMFLTVAAEDIFAVLSQASTVI